MFARLENLIGEKLFLIVFLIILAQLSVIAGGSNLTETAQAKSKSSGNEAVREINSGLDLTGRTKTEVLKLIGAPWKKDMSPAKARYNEKWTYSCEDKRGATSNCLFIYFSTDRVKNVEIY